MREQGVLRRALLIYLLSTHKMRIHLVQSKRVHFTNPPKKELVRKTSGFRYACW